MTVPSSRSVLVGHVLVGEKLVLRLGPCVCLVVYSGLFGPTQPQPRRLVDECSPSGGFSQLTEDFVMPNRSDGLDILRGDVAAQRNSKPSH